MNCFNHPDEPAVSQCTDCQKGLCVACSTSYKPHLCTPCYELRKKEEVKQAVISLIIYAVIFFFAYKLSYSGVEINDKSNQWKTAYFFISIYTGYKIYNRYIAWKAIRGTALFLLMFNLLKFLISVFIGWFATPFVILWQFSRIIKAYLK